MVPSSAYTDHSSRSYRNLSPKSKLGVGVGMVVWGVVGLRLSEKAEDKFGYKPTEADKDALEKMTPKITVIKREER